jgi:hypothetical protein
VGMVVSYDWKYSLFPCVISNDYKIQGSLLDLNLYSVPRSEKSEKFDIETEPTMLEIFRKLVLADITMIFCSIISK